MANRPDQGVPAFLLTRQWRDGDNGIELEFWASSPRGPLRLLIPGQQAVCFIHRQQSLPRWDAPFRRRELALETLTHQPVDGLYFNQQRQLQRFHELAERQEIALFESDLKPADRYLMERFVTAPMAVVGRFREKSGFLEVHQPRVRPEPYHPRLCYLSLDIETDGIGGEILSIALCNRQTAAVFMQGDGNDWNSSLPITWLHDEKALLAAFLDRFGQLDPDLILGWNLVNFDLDYLERRCRLHGIPFTLGRNGEIATVLQPRQETQVRVASIPGRVPLDGIDNLKTAFWSFDSFELDHVAQQLLGRGKLLEKKQDRIAEIRRLFQQDRPALAAYNLEDCRLVEAIFEKTDLIDFALQRAALTGLPLGRQGGSVAAFDNLYLPRLHRAGRVAHDVGATARAGSSPGGYVMDSQPGLYDNVLVLDFKSLYPSIIRTFQIDPFGMATTDDDGVPGFLEARFARQGGILPGIITDLWSRRDEARKAGNAPLSQAIKIIMNSFYGVLGSNGCRFFDPRLTSSITRRGHQIIMRSRDWLEKAGYRVIYGDTDSLFVLLGPGHSETEAAATGERLAADLNDWWRKVILDEFALPSYLEIEFETHFIRFLMPTIRGGDTGSKKRYAGYVRGAGAEFKLVFKGLESVRSDWTPLARRFQEELYRRIFFNQPYEEYIREVITSLGAGELDDQLVYRKRIRRPLDDYRRNVPPHVQAARKLESPGRWISYLATQNGPEPVSAHVSPIDYQHYMDRQLAPVADAILHFVDDSFERIAASQLALF